MARNKNIQRAQTKDTRTWVFYYVVNRGADQIVLGTFDCKQPQRTNMYKELQKCWKLDKVTSIGYTTDVNDPFHVWPQTSIPQA